MPNFKPISVSQDLNAGWKPYENYHFTAKETAVSIVLSELNQVMQQSIIAFVRLNENEYRLVAVQGLYPNENLFVDLNGRWLGGYVPSAYRTYPFSLQRVKNGESEELAVCINTESGLYSEDPDSEKDENSFFDNDGELLPEMKKVVEHLQLQSSYNKLTQEAVNSIERMDLFVPLDLKVNNPYPENEALIGFYRVSEEKLNKLDADQLKQLQDSHALLLAYAQLFSMSRIKILNQLSDLKAKHSVNKKNITESDINELFGETGNDTISFDF